MLVPMKVVQEVGMMAEIFFLYYEEHDWAAHIKRAGYRIFYQGKSLVLHKESISTVKDSPFQIFYLTRGRVLYARRNSFGLTGFFSMMYLYLIAWPKLTLGFILRKRFDLANALKRAMVWNLLNHKGIHETPQLKKLTK